MFEIKLPLPPSVNESYAVIRGRKILTRKARNWKWEAINSIISKLGATYGVINLRMITCKVKVSVYFVFPDNRRRDQSNYIKMLYDAFPKAGLIKDDSQIVEEHIYSRVEKGKREVTIRIEEIE